MTASASRRRLLLGGAAAVATSVAAPALRAAPASAATYAPNPYRATPLPTAQQRHYLSRLGCGLSRTSFAAMVADGGETAWFERQLAPASVPESATALALPGWYPDLADAPATRWSKHVAGAKQSWKYAENLAACSMLRQVYSTRQLLETMVGFWSDHLHVHANADLGWVHRSTYDDTIRAHALGRFDDLLVATALHPAMLLYLDNWRSVRGAPNENHGRELLELHTVGRGSGYTETMVKDSARILSGYTVDAHNTWAGYYDPARHTTGTVKVLGFAAPNDAPDGQQLAVDYLRYLARHPATAQSVARRLARRFVSDAPSSALVGAVAQTFRDSGTDIRATLRTLVAHPEFAASTNRLVRTPVEDFVATCRVLEVAAAPPTSDLSFARSCVWSLESTLPHHWPRPDGSPVGNPAWSSASRMLSSFRMHWNLAAGWYPTVDVTYRTPASWLPQPSIRLDQYVDHLCRVLLGKGSDSRLLTAAVTATGYGPTTVLTRDHPVCTWMFVRLLGTLLDSPDHMRR
ncbi:MAG TPA: DUF1800 domain-containing protein [Nocardioidaceae bacterium]|nr:DUF1800 domain-containing protein [Nocardioidaceae bacterium]